ncbi:hypothetical protein ACIBL8_39095 [Streptomyces sp. NPDC050523]|uniref:hypothetical protein n=1 Tax=Streptomyces sp. NPDC050523 TaxID=3365622 RepID=UPI0037ACD081
MARAPEPKTLEVDGALYANRAWIAEETGATIPTVRTWYIKRDTQPAECRFPEKGPRVEREDYFNVQEVLAFHRWLKESKQAKVLPTDPALYDGDPDDLVSINDAAAYFHFTDASVIRTYIRNNPGYFADVAGHVQGPTGRLRPAFRRSDLQDFDRRRNGDNTGRAGSPGGPRPERGTRTPEVQQRIDTAAAHLTKAGGHHHGIAAEIARAHGEPTWKWERAVKAAREQIARGRGEA